MAKTNYNALLSPTEAAELIAWMKKIQHVERLQAMDLIQQGRLTRLHADYFHAATTGLSFTQFKELRGVR